MISLLKTSVIRGEASNGMLVSEREMGLSDEHEGIIELDDDAPVGVPFAQVLGLDDPLIDIAITPNRGDCLGVRGIARDLAAAGLGRLKPFARPDVASTLRARARSEMAARSAGRSQQHRLPLRRRQDHFSRRHQRPQPQVAAGPVCRSIGLRPISALVDITNFVTLDLGRPLHVFDADKLRRRPHHAASPAPGEEDPRPRRQGPTHSTRKWW